MGPRQMIAEITMRPSISVPRTASMGPRSADRGNEQPRFGHVLSSYASMGPRSADRGNCLERTEWPQPHCFNGAAIS